MYYATIKTNTDTDAEVIAEDPSFATVWASLGEKVWEEHNRLREHHPSTDFWVDISMSDEHGAVVCNWVFGHTD
ncbi:MAG: hypothetical protein PVI91_18015 [Gammaproteobacteria bacterium]|jgi:hypothetical protein